MRLLNFSSVALAVLAVAACDRPVADNGPTSPDTPIFGKSTGGPCDAATARTISSQQATLWSKPTLDDARARFGLVEAGCGTDAGKDLMLSYVQWTLDNKGSIISQRKGSVNQNLLDHWNTVFPYVGYTGDDQPGALPLTIFGAEGKAKVAPKGDETEIAAKNAAITMYAQNSAGDDRSHLIVIYPITANCLTGTNLTQFGPCFQFSSFPHVKDKFSPAYKVGVCQQLKQDVPLPANAALGHLDTDTRITGSKSTYPAVCDDTDAPVAGSWTGGAGDVVKRLAWLARTAVTPKPLYAVHGGLGGLGTSLSPFGAVDLQVFNATFTNDAIGAAPGTPEVGAWFKDVKAPGTILVQGSLGNISSELAVLTQGGGNCANCGGLLLKGTMATQSSPASYGIYDVEFIALQDQSNMKEAVFALRDTNGRDIATVTYAVRSNVNVIIYNDAQTGGGVTVGNWFQHKSAKFRVRVDLDAKTTTLYFNGSATPAVSNRAFLAANATNLASISADFNGIDSGTMGWDSIKITRQADLY